MNKAASSSGANAASNGMSGLQIMPFPFLNPWNWAALTPPRAAAASVVMMRCALDASRFLLDACRAAWRAQQDVLLQAIETSLMESQDGRLTAEEAAAARFISTPVLGAIDAFGVWNDAILRADGVASDHEIVD